MVTFFIHCHPIILKMVQRAWWFWILIHAMILLIPTYNIYPPMIRLMLYTNWWFSPSSSSLPNMRTTWIMRCSMWWIFSSFTWTCGDVMPKSSAFFLPKCSLLLLTPERNTPGGSIKNWHLKTALYNDINDINESSRMVVWVMLYSSICEWCSAAFLFTGTSDASGLCVVGRVHPTTKMIGWKIVSFFHGK